MNKIHYIENETTSVANIKYVVVDGSKIKSMEDFVDYVEKELDFPTSCEHGIAMLARFEDWIRDLSWFNYDTYIFIIYNYKEFMKNNEKEKKLIISIFEELILPWWEKDVLECVNGEETKNFQLYLF